METEFSFGHALPEVDVVPCRPEGAGSVEISLLRRVFGALRAFAPVDMVAVIDLSKWNTVVDWGALYESGVRAVILRASFGTTGIDAKFSAYIQAAHAAGLLVMVYHYFHSDKGGAVQANHVWTQIVPHLDMLGYIPVVWCDVEDLPAGVSNSARLARVKEFLYAIQSLQQNAGSAVGRCGVYTSPGFANSYMSPAPVWIGDFLQWVAHWWAGDYAVTPAGWDLVPDVWQYGIWDLHGWVETVAGCEDDIDRDWFVGDEVSLVLFCTGAATPPPDPIPPDPPPGVPAIPPAAARAKVINTKGVNVRKEPDAAATVVSGVPFGVSLPVWEHVVKANEEEWVHVTTDGQVAGWCCMVYPPYGTGAQLMEWEWSTPWDNGF